MIVRPDHTKASDADLLQAADAEAFAVLYDRHVGGMFVWARSRVGGHAADLTAEVFARAWLCRASFEDRADGSALPWLYGIAHNVLRDSLRRQRVEDRARRRLGLPLTVAPDPGYEAVEQRLSLPDAALRALAALPESERELLDLRVVQERSYWEIAARLRCTPQAARLRVSRTLRRLNLVLAVTGGAPMPTAEAAIMRHVAAALTSPPATVLHERALVTAGSTTAPYELWIDSNPPHAFRVIKWGHEATGTGGTPTDPAATLRSLVASGHAHVAATTTFDGVPAYKLTVSGSPDRFLNGTAYVSRTDYYPLEIDTTGNGGERIVVHTYEYLPATPANLALLK